MAETAAKESGDSLFQGMSIPGFDESLLTVDFAPNEVVEEVVKEVSDEGGPGAPPETKTEDPPGFKPREEKKPEEKPTDFLEVDKLAAGEEKPPETGGDKTKPKEGTKTGKGEENLSPMYLHAAALQENGLLPNFDLEAIKDLKPDEQVLKINEHIQTNVSESIKEGVDAEKAKMDVATKMIYEDLEAGVDPNALRENVSLEKQYGGVKVADLEDNPESQEIVYANSLYMKGLSEKRVNQLVQVSKDADTLLVDSTEGLKEIQTAVTSERQQMRNDAAAQKSAHEEKNRIAQEKIKETVTSTKAIIPGQDLTKAEQDQLIKNMTVPVRYVDGPNGQQVPVSKVMDLRSKDAITFDMRLNYFIEKGFFDKDAKFDNLEVKATTNATKSLIEKLNSNNSQALGNPAITEDGNNENKTNDFVFPKNMI